MVLLLESVIMYISDQFFDAGFEMKLIDKKYEMAYARVKAIISEASSVLIVPHDFPDPDSIGAAVGLRLLSEHLGVTRCDIAFAGFIGRAENRAMVELLEIEHLNLNDIDVGDYDCIVTVDTLPDNGNVSINDVSIVDLVIDHHPANELEKHPGTVYEIHTDVGATSTMITIFLLLAAVEVSSKIATALFYGIKTDTSDMARNCHDIDILCYKFLFDLIEHSTLSHIESPQREEEYFRLLHSAAEDLVVYGNVAYSHLGKVTIPDYVPEMADIFHSLKELEWIVCSAVFGDNIIYSIRSKKDIRAGGRARKIAQIFNGSGGGHPTMSAGRVPLSSEQEKNFKDVVLDLFDINEETRHKLLIDNDTDT